jgi:hypothetical protein
MGFLAHAAAYHGHPCPCASVPWASLPMCQRTMGIPAHVPAYHGHPLPMCQRTMGIPAHVPAYHGHPLPMSGVAWASPPVRPGADRGRAKLETRKNPAPIAIAPGRTLLTKIVWAEIHCDFGEVRNSIVPTMSSWFGGWPAQPPRAKYRCCSSHRQARGFGPHRRTTRHHAFSRRCCTGLYRTVSARELRARDVADKG